MQASINVDAIMDCRQDKRLLHELQTADAQVYRGRQLQPTEIQLLYTSHVGHHSMPKHLLKDLSSEALRGFLAVSVFLLLNGFSF